MVNDWMAREVKEILPQLVAWRRDFHRFPEPGWVEYRTTAVIAEALRAWGWNLYLGDDAIDVKQRMGVPAPDVLHIWEERALAAGVTSKLLAQMRGGKTGLVAEWNSGVPGPIIAFRFDIDSNEVEEATGEEHRPAVEGFRSAYANCMHGCGHDGHAAIGLGLAHLIAQHGKELKGTVRLLFQPAEEGARGALAMVEKGWLDDVDYFLSGHIGFRVFQLGEIVLNTTGFYVTTKWDAQYRGKAAHAGGNPELGKNALLAAATAALNLHAIPRHSAGSSRVNVGTLRAGTGRNVVPESALMAFETRGANESVHRYLNRQAARILQGAGEMYDVELMLQKVGEAGEATGDQALVDRLKSVIPHVSGVQKIHERCVLGASEDVTHMMRRVQAQGGQSTYMMFGTPLAAEHHQSRFDFDERVLGIALEAYVRALLSLSTTEGEDRSPETDMDHRGETLR